MRKNTFLSYTCEYIKNMECWPFFIKTWKKVLWPPISLQQLKSNIAVNWAGLVTINWYKEKCVKMFCSERLYEAHLLVWALWVILIFNNMLNRKWKDSSFIKYIFPVLRDKEGPEKCSWTNPREILTRNRFFKPYKTKR